MLKCAIFLSIFMIILSFSAPVVAVYANEELPELIITEIVADNDPTDAFEYIEIFNVSDKPINFYDYSIAYCADITSSSYNGPNKITRIVPGNFSTSLKDKSRAFDNPTEFILMPQDIAVVWFWSFDSFAAGVKLDDFRRYYKIGSDVKIIAVDADSSADTGNADRFNLQNSGYRGICIVRNGFALNSGFEGVISMATLDYNKITSSIPDLGAVYGKSTTNDIWRLTMTEFWAEPTPGYLTELQSSVFMNNADSSETSTESAETSDHLPISAVLFVAFASAAYALRRKRAAGSDS